MIVFTNFVRFIVFEPIDEDAVIGACGKRIQTHLFIETLCFGYGLHFCASCEKFGTVRSSYNVSTLFLYGFEWLDLIRRNLEDLRICKQGNFICVLIPIRHNNIVFVHFCVDVLAAKGVRLLVSTPALLDTHNRFLGRYGKRKFFVFRFWSDQNMDVNRKKNVNGYLIITALIPYKFEHDSFLHLSFKNIVI